MGFGFRCALQPIYVARIFFSSSSLISSLELSDTKVYETYTRDLLDTASQFCELIVLRSRNVPNGTTLSLRNLRVTCRGGWQPDDWRVLSLPASRPLRPTVGDTVGTTTPFSVYHPIHLGLITWTRGLTPSSRCRANTAHTRQSRPDSGLGFQVKLFETFSSVPALRGCRRKTCRVASRHLKAPAPPSQSSFRCPSVASRHKFKPFPHAIPLIEHAIWTGVSLGPALDFIIIQHTRCRANMTDIRQSSTGAPELIKLKISFDPFSHEGSRK